MSSFLELWLKPGAGLGKMQLRVSLISLTVEKKNMLTISGHVSKGTCLFDSLYKNSLHIDTNCVKGNAF